LAPGGPTDEENQVKKICTVLGILLL
jgi:hypothetical protein